jgi:hypothetical protein
VIRLDSTSEVDYFGNRVSPSPPSVSLEKLGDEIVNSISIHKLTSDHPAVVDDVVAVLTNNDKSIRIFSLTQNIATASLELPFPVNHATISPDGQLLIAVGDYQQCYFYERADLKPSPDARSQKYASAHCLWELLDVVLLHVPKALASSSTGYFSTAWSPNGRLCAVASEMGYISIIDVEALKALEQGEDAIVTVIQSTRPELTLPHGGCPGAVRTMLFSPSPWDLLIWSEDQGRVCVADLRNGLRARQVLHLTPDQDGPKYVDVKDSPTNRYSRVRDDDLTAEYHRQLRSQGIDNDSPIDAEDTFLAMEQLSARERELVLGRQRLESLRNSSEARSIRYSELSGRTQRSTAAQRQEARQSSAFSQDFPDLVRQSQTTTTHLPSHARLVHDYMREYMSNAETDQALYVPGSRRQASTIAGETSAGSSSRLNRLLSEGGPFASSSRSSTTVPDWAGILAMTADGDSTVPPSSLFHNEPPRSGRPSPPPATGALNEVRRRRAVLQEQARRRALANREAERYHQMGFHRQDTYDPSFGLRTAGLAISWDGRKIWAACDKGVFEYEINIRGRMMMPSIEMR